MGSIRVFLLSHGRLALLLLALIFAAKAFVPAGYMLGAPGKVLTISICADAQGASFTRQIVVPHSKADGGGAAQAKGDCAWASQTFAATPGADPIVLALALAFILALGFAAVTPPLLASVHRLRPPLRGPPASI